MHIKGCTLRLHQATASSAAKSSSTTSVHIGDVLPHAELQYQFNIEASTRSIHAHLHCKNFISTSGYSTVGMMTPHAMHPSIGDMGNVLRDRFISSSEHDAFSFDGSGRLRFSDQNPFAMNAELSSEDQHLDHSKDSTAASEDLQQRNAAEETIGIDRGASVERGRIDPDLDDVIDEDEDMYLETDFGSDMNPDAVVPESSGL